MECIATIATRELRLRGLGSASTRFDWAVEARLERESRSSQFAGPLASPDHLTLPEQEESVLMANLREENEKLKQACNALLAEKQKLADGLKVR